MSLRLPGNHDLKGKRKVAQSVISRVRGKFNVAIAEIDDQDLWQRLTLGISCVSNSGPHANEILSKVASYIEETTGDAEMLDYEIEMVSGI